jgi:hypothetical protein
MKARFQFVTRLAATLAITVGSASCGEVVRTGRSPAMLVIDSLVAASGAKAGEFGGFLNSDVQVLVKQTVAGVEVETPTIVNDVGKVTMRIVLKDRGSPAQDASPTPVNAITLSRYRVVYKRADGRGTQGVDVPYPFDGAVTATITESPVEVNFELVRHSAKIEPPLATLVNRGGQIEIATIAEITFYGRDLVGNDAQVTGTITVDFADFADPKN